MLAILYPDTSDGQRRLSHYLNFLVENLPGRFVTRFTKIQGAKSAVYRSVFIWATPS